MFLDIKNIVENIIGNIIGTIFAAILIGLWVKNRDNKQAIMNAITELYFNDVGTGTIQNPFKLDDVYKLTLLKILPNNLQNNVMQYIKDAKNAQRPGSAQKPGSIYGQSKELSKSLEDYLTSKWCYNLYFL